MIGLDDETTDVLVLGIGNILWADEGFGPRAVEAFHREYQPRDGVHVADGGTLGLYLTNLITATKKLIVVDCVDFKEAPGFMKVIRGEELQVWSSTKISPHQNGFNDMLATAMLLGHELEKITVVGVQPNVLDDYGGSLTPLLEECLPKAVELVAQELADWGFPVTKREPGEVVEPLMAECVEVDRYVSERPSQEVACRDGDERFMTRAAGEAVVDPDVPSMRS